MRNVLILHTDQQRYDCLGCSSNPYIETPNIDALAAEGTVFTRHISANTVCMPSRASLLTGLYPPGHGVWENGVALNRREYIPFDRDRHGDACVHQPTTMADMFAEAGYNTAAFGKLHLTPFLAPESYGYHECSKIWNSGKLDDWYGPYYGFEHYEAATTHGPLSVGHYMNHLRREHPDVLQAIRNKMQSPRTTQLGDLLTVPTPVELHPSLWLADRFCDYLKQKRDGSKPFFAFVGFPDPHHPFTPCEDIAKRFEGAEVHTPHDPEGHAIEESISSRMGESIAKLSEHERKRVIQYTYAMIYQIDMAVGKILNALKDNDEWDNTIIVFTSDHGDFLADHALLRKGHLASHSLLHIPFILRAPGEKQPSRVDIPMSNADVLPTLASMTDVTGPDYIHGEDILNVLEHGQPHHAFSYSGGIGGGNYTVYDDKHRYTYSPASGRVDLFDHQEDPGECRNIASSAGNRDLVEHMQRLIEGALMTHYRPILNHVAPW